MDYTKIRIRFHKDGDLRLIGHKDLMRCFERMLRRADLPIRWTQGFNPHPRLALALPLPLGMVGCEEVAEFELEGSIAALEVHERLVRQAPPGFRILRTVALSEKTKAHVCRAGYRIALPASRHEEVRERIAALCDQTHYWVERTRPKARRFDLKPFLEALRCDGQALDIILKVTPTGGARPEEVLEALGLGDLVRDGAVFHRFLLELEDEMCPSPVTSTEAAAAEPVSVPGT